MNHSLVLRQHGIESEFVDILHGRVTPTVFARHYYRPDFNQYADRVRGLLGKSKPESLC